MVPGMSAVIAAIAAALAFTQPVVCQPSWAAYDAAAGLPAGTTWWAGIGGYYSWQRGEIGLTSQACADLVNLRKGYTWQRGYAAFTLAHELGHASGLVDEAQADCYGAKHAAAVAYLLGLRRRAAFVSLRGDGLELWGYSPIPPSCFAGGG